MEPTVVQPRLTWWSHVWRYTLVVAISAVSWWAIGTEQLQTRPAWFWADGAIGLGCAVLVWWRREHAVAVNVIVNLLSAVSASTGGPATLAMVSLATRRRWREILPIAVLSFVAGVVQLAIMPTPAEWAFSLPFVVAVVGVTVGWGLFIGSRRELVHTLRDRAHRAESEQAARVAQARAAERTRIAREMHDVMAHRISLVTMHAGALAFRDDLDPDQVKRTATTIQETSHQALAELREVLGVLREDVAGEAPELPQPSAADLVALVDDARSAGMRVALETEVDLTEVPDPLGRTAYRVVQEGLTNVRKHAPATSARVHLARVDDGLLVQVVNPLSIGQRSTSLAMSSLRSGPRGSGPPDSGLGLVGLRERAELAGGRLTHQVTAGREFVLGAWLPWPT